MVYPIKLNNTDDVQRVSKVAAESGLDVLIHDGNSVFDPRSILGLFNLIGKRVLLVAPDRTSPQQFTSLIEKMHVPA